MQAENAMMFTQALSGWTCILITRRAHVGLHS